MPIDKEQQYQAWLCEQASNHTGEIAWAQTGEWEVQTLLEAKLDEILDMGVDCSYIDHRAADKLLREYWEGL